MTVIRASSTDRIMQCPQSSVRPKGEVRVSASGDVAALGTAVHEYLAQVASGGISIAATVQATPYVAKHGIDGDEFERLVDYGLVAWSELRHEFPTPNVERHGCYPLGDNGDQVKVSLSGHRDVSGGHPQGPTRRVLDWKTGWKADAGTYWNQMAAYCWLELQDHPQADKATAVIVWLRDRSFDTLHFTRPELDAWAKRLRGRVMAPGETYSPGRCQYCPRAMTCPGLRQELRGALSLATDLDNGEKLTGARIVELYRGLQEWARIDKAARAIIKALVEAGGDIEGDGHKLTISERATDKLDPQRAWPILSERLTDRELAGIVTLPKTRLIKAVREKVPSDAKRGAKGQAEKEIMGALRGAGAVSKAISTSLALVKAE